MLCELKSNSAVSGLVSEDVLGRIFDGQLLFAEKPANDERAFRPFLLERRRRRQMRRRAH